AHDPGAELWLLLRARQQLGEHQWEDERIPRRRGACGTRWLGREAINVAGGRRVLSPAARWGRLVRPSYRHARHQFVLRLISLPQWGRSRTHSRQSQAQLRGFSFLVWFRAAAPVILP